MTQKGTLRVFQEETEAQLTGEGVVRGYRSKETAGASPPPYKCVK